MKRNVLGVQTFLEWKVPRLWNDYHNQEKTYPWTKQFKKGGIAFILFFLMILILYNNEVGIGTIFLISFLMALLFILGDTSTMKKNKPRVSIFRSIIRVKYWEGKNDIELSKIDSYQFNRININGSQVSILILKLKDSSVFEVGIPDQEFENQVRSILSGKFDIPCFGSIQSKA